MTKEKFIETNSKFLDNKCVRCMPVRIRLQLVAIYNECHEEKLINRVSDHAKAYEWIRNQITPAGTPVEEKVVLIESEVPNPTPIEPETETPAETPVEEKPKVKRTRKPKTE